MTTSRQRDATRQNAQRSTGPRTVAGKKASSGNARRHGLTAAPDMDAVLSWYRVLLEDETAVLDPFEQNPYRHAAAELARAEAHLQRVCATVEQLLNGPDSLSNNEKELVHLRQQTLGTLVDDSLEMDVLSLIPPDEQWLLPRDRPRRNDEAYFNMLERFAQSPLTEVGWDREGFSLLRRLDMQIARFREERQRAHERIAPTFARYRALAEARRLRALARWTAQVALRPSSQESNTQLGKDTTDRTRSGTDMAGSGGRKRRAKA